MSEGPENGEKKEKLKKTHFKMDKSQ
jgi:hypothetical protein